MDHSSLITNLLIGGAGGTATLLAKPIIDFFKAKKLKKLDVTYKYLIPVTNELFNKLVNIKFYFTAKHLEDIGSDFIKTVPELNKDQQKSTLIHIDELKEILNKNQLFLSKQTIKSVEKFIQECGFLYNIELNEDQDMFKKEGKRHYKNGIITINKITQDLRKELGLYF
ncbi:hypothetical protein COB57_05420 [Candidatus Peregrinibacteria bacterium]|nr:MAG: hypothetical protein COB57_05420 [Candidatus Peregrinibacteria bacterium]